MPTVGPRQSSGAKILDSRKEWDLQLGVQAHEYAPREVQIVKQPCLQTSPPVALTIGNATIGGTPHLKSHHAWNESVWSMEWGFAEDNTVSHTILESNCTINLVHGGGLSIGPMKVGERTCHDGGHPIAHTTPNANDNDLNLNLPPHNHKGIALEAHNISRNLIEPGAAIPHAPPHSLLPSRGIPIGEDGMSIGAQLDCMLGNSQTSNPATTQR